MELNTLAIVILIVVFLATAALEGYAKYKCENSDLNK